MRRIEEVLKHLPVSVEDIMHGVGWDSELMPLGVSFEKARVEAAQRTFENPYAERLWLVIIYLAALCENKDYREQKSGLFNCQSAVFYLNMVASNFSDMIEAMEKTSAKLAKDGNPTRAELYEGLAVELKDLRDKILNVRGIINRY